MFPVKVARMFFCGWIFVSWVQNPVYAVLERQLCESEFFLLDVPFKKSKHGPIVADVPLQKIPEALSDRRKLLQSVVLKLQLTNLLNHLSLTSPDKDCFICSSRLMQAMRSHGIQLKHIEVDNDPAPLVLRDGTQLASGAYHHFLVLEADRPERELIVDPTYRQFMDPAVRDSLRPVFVGTRADLIHLIEENGSRVNVLSSNGGLIVVENVDAEKFVQSHWGFGPSAGKRRQIDDYDQDSQ